MTDRAIFLRAFVAAAVVVAVAALWLGALGHLSLDEGVIHLQVRAMAAGHGFDLQTGYHHIASPEFLYVVPGITGHTKVVGERVVGQYPFLFSALAAGPFRVLGLAGAVAVNALAAAVTAGFTASLGARLSGSSRGGYLAAAALLAGFFLEYALAIWPHMTSTALLTAGSYFAVLATEDRKRRHGALTGALLAAAVCVRLDAVIFAAAICFALAAAPGNRKRSVPVLVGAAPVMALLSLTNVFKFGSLNPLTYGPADALGAPGTILAGASMPSAPETRLLEFVWLLPLALVTASAWVMVVRGRMQTHRRARVLWGLAFLVALLAMGPGFRQLVRGALGVLVDLAWLSDAVAQMRRAESGALLFGSGVKASVLQSFPHAVAVVALVAAAYSTCEPRARRTLEILVAPALAAAVFFSFASWHGVASFNVRYFLPATPALAVLSVFVGHRLVAAAAAAQRTALTVICIALPVMGLAAGPLLFSLPMEEQETYVRVVPLFLMVVAAGCAGAFALRGKAPELAAVTLAVAMSFAAALGCYHAVATADLRRSHADIGAEVMAQLGEPTGTKTVVVTALAAPLFTVFDRPETFLASAQSDHGADLGRVVADAMEQGMTVALVFPLSPFTQQEFGRHLGAWSLRVTPLTGGLGFFVVERPETPAAPL